jgi:hypothetical protein
MGGGGTGSASGSMGLVPEGEKYNGREDQSTELAGEGVAKVDGDGGERPGAKCHDEDCHQGAKGRFCFYFFQRQISGRWAMGRDDEDSTTKGIMGPSDGIGVSAENTEFTRKMSFLSLLFSELK